MPVVLAIVCFCVGWRMYRQEVRLEFLSDVGARCETQPASPEWMHRLIKRTLGKERTAGFTDVVNVDLGNTPVTDDGLRHLCGLGSLRHLSLYNTPITDEGLRNLNGLNQPDCSPWFQWRLCLLDLLQPWHCKMY